MKQSNWQNIISNLSIESLDQQELFDIIDELFIPYSVNPHKFLNNFKLFGDITRMISDTSILETLDKPTESALLFIQPESREPTIPDWFHAAFPDVVNWFQETRRNMLNKPSVSEDYATSEIGKLLGIDVSALALTEHQILDKRNNYCRKYLCNLVDSYLKLTDAVLETVECPYNI